MTAPTLNASRKTKKTHIGELPVDWAVCKLGDVVKINARTLSEKTPLEFSFSYLDLSAVDEGKISYPTEKIQILQCAVAGKTTGDGRRHHYVNSSSES